MKYKCEFSVSRAELDSARKMINAIAEEFGEKFSVEDLDTPFSHSVRLKCSAGNVLTAVRLGDVYEYVVEVDVDERAFETIAETTVEVVPMIAGLLKSFNRLNSRLNDLFEPTDIETYVDNVLQE